MRKKEQRRRWSESEKAEIVRTFKKSGISLSAFGREVGIKGGLIGRWLQREESKGRRAVIPVRVTRSVAPSEDETVEIVVRGGRRLRVGLGFDEELLRRLILVLEAC